MSSGKRKHVMVLSRKPIFCGKAMRVDNHSPLKILPDSPTVVTRSISFGEHFQRLNMASKSLKSKTKTKHTDLHDIIDEIARDSGSELLQDESDRNYYKMNQTVTILLTLFLRLCSYMEKILCWIGE
jgi:hypothetical protein